MNPDFKHQGEHSAWNYRFVKPCHYCDYLQVSCIGQDRTSCGCCLSVGLNCPNLTYHPPAGANPKTLFIPPWWDSSDKVPLRNAKFFQHPGHPPSVLPQIQRLRPCLTLLLSRPLWWSLGFPSSPIMLSVIVKRARTSEPESEQSA